MRSTRRSPLGRLENLERLALARRRRRRRAGLLAPVEPPAGEPSHGVLRPSIPLEDDGVPRRRPCPEPKTPRLTVLSTQSRRAGRHAGGAGDGEAPGIARVAWPSLRTCGCWREPRGLGRGEAIGPGWGPGLRRFGCGSNLGRLGPGLDGGGGVIVGVSLGLLVRDWGWGWDLGCPAGPGAGWRWRGDRRGDTMLAGGRGRAPTGGPRPARDDRSAHRSTLSMAEHLAPCAGSEIPDDLGKLTCDPNPEDLSCAPSAGAPAPPAVPPPAAVPPSLVPPPAAPRAAPPASGITPPAAVTPSAITPPAAPGAATPQSSLVPPPAAPRPAVHPVVQW